MSDAPLFYEELNALISKEQPSALHYLDNQLAQFYAERLIKKALAPWKISAPDSWDIPYFMYTLFCNGYVAIIKTAKYGIIPQRCGLGPALNVYRQPASVMIANPLLPDINEQHIGTDCALLRLQPDYRGVLPVVAHYASMMALADQALMSNLQQSKVAWIFGASGRANAETLKQMFDQIMRGELGVFSSKQSLIDEHGEPCFQLFNTSIKESFIAPDLQTVIHDLEHDFLRQIGIATANTDKRERLVKDEVTRNNFDTQSLVLLWLDTLNRGIEQAKKLFPELELSIELREEMLSSVDDSATADVDF